MLVAAVWALGVLGGAALEQSGGGRRSLVSPAHHGQHAPCTVTVVTVVDSRNGAALRTTAASLALQTLPRFEWVVVACGTSSSAVLEPLPDLSPHAVSALAVPGHPSLGLCLQKGLQRARSSPFVSVLAPGDTLAVTMLEMLVWALWTMPFSSMAGFHVVHRDPASAQRISTSTFSFQHPDILQVVGAVPLGTLVRTVALLDGYALPDNGSPVATLHEAWHLVARRLLLSGAHGHTVPVELVWRDKPALCTVCRLPPVDTDREATVLATRYAPPDIPSPGSPSWLPPFLNHYAKPSLSDQACVIALPSLEPGAMKRSALWLAEVLIARGWSVTVALTLARSDPLFDNRAPMLRFTSDIFTLPTFLPTEDHPRFLLHLLNSRSASLLLSFEDAFVFSVLRELREEAPDVFAVGVVHSQLSVPAFVHHEDLFHGFIVTSSLAGQRMRSKHAFLQASVAIARVPIALPWQPVGGLPMPQRVSISTTAFSRRASRLDVVLPGVFHALARLRRHGGVPVPSVEVLGSARWVSQLLSKTCEVGHTLCSVFKPAVTVHRAVSDRTNSEVLRRTQLYIHAAVADEADVEPLLLALAHGCVVVVFDEGHVPELLGDAVFRVIPVPRHDPQRMQQLVARAVCEFAVLTNAEKAEWSVRAMDRAAVLARQPIPKDEHMDTVLAILERIQFLRRVVPPFLSPEPEDAMSQLQSRPLTHTTWQSLLKYQRKWGPWLLSGVVEQQQREANRQSSTGPSSSWSRTVLMLYFLAIAVFSAVCYFLPSTHPFLRRKRTSSS